MKYLQEIWEHALSEGLSQIGYQGLFNSARSHGTLKIAHGNIEFKDTLHPEYDSRTVF
jgi:hypothetical protein